MTATPRARLVSAILVAVLTTVTSLVAIGVTAGGEGSAVTLAQAHTGDAWTYDITLGDGWASQSGDPVQPGATSHVFAFSLHSAEIRLGDLAVHDASRLNVKGYAYWPHGVYDEPGEARWQNMSRSAWFDQGGLMATEGRSALGKASGSGSAIVLEQSNSLSVESVYRSFDPHIVPCLGPNEAAGKTIGVGDKVTLWMDCTLGGILENDEQAFRAEGIDQVGDMKAMRLSNGDGFEAWFNPGIPYPVKVQVPVGEGHGGAILTLSGFQPGTAAFPVVDQGPRQSVAITLAPPQPWGPDDTESGNPFPASEAFELARSAPGWSALRAFLDSHPDAFAAWGHFQLINVAADYLATTQDAGRHLSWYFAVRGGDDVPDCLTFEVTRNEPKATLFDPFPQSDESFEETPFGCEVYGGKTGFEPMTAVRPSAWPTVGSALAAWDSYGQAPQDGVRAWAFMAGAKGEPMKMVAGAPTLVGQELRSFAGSSVGLVGGDEGLELEGPTPVGLSRRDVAFSYSAEVAGMPVPRTSAVPPESAEQRHSLPAAVSSALSPAVATGVGVLSLLAGALYFLWPSLKGGLFGLFSRVQPEQVLEHPQRAKLVQAVESEPGIHYQALLRKTGLAKGALEHHLHALVAAGHLRKVANGGYTCYFVGAPVRGASALKSAGARRLLQELQTHPGVGLVEAASASGLSPATASPHLARLEEAGLVTSLREGRSRRLFPTAAAASAA
ncbi:MAG: hypothetical protein QOC71_166 [Thermoplasmata archaeon]|nr:hypothetical protein [Thermoplasmata archaeon]